MGIESNQGSTPEFDEFAAAGDVEVGKPAGGEAESEPKDDKKGGGSGKPPKVKETVTPKAPVAGDDEGGDEGEDEGRDDEGGDEEDQKPKRTAKDQQIDRLKREKADLNKRLRALEGGAGSADLSRRLENIEKGLSGANRGDTQDARGKAPDPSDTTKYPLGHLDDRYIEDKLEWLADEKAAKQAGSALQRQQEIERNEAARRQQSDILAKVDDLASKGADIADDFQEAVVESGMRGDWDLSQPTFEAAHEAEHGAQILYNLSQDPKEATRVAKLSPFQQLKYVQEKDAELAKGKRGNTKPQAGDPPKNTARGANSRTNISPATDNLDDFEKAWERDAKANKR